MFCVNGCEIGANPFAKRKTTLNSPTQVSAGYANISPIIQINLPPWPRATTPFCCPYRVKLFHKHVSTPRDVGEELGKSGAGFGIPRVARDSTDSCQYLIVLS